MPTGSDVSRILGRWRSDPTDRDAIEEYGAVSLEFREDGQLTYLSTLKRRRRSSISRFGFRTASCLRTNHQLRAKSAPPLT